MMSIINIIPIGSVRREVKAGIGRNDTHNSAEGARWCVMKDEK